jgi:hypothetical protein
MILVAASIRRLKETDLLAWILSFPAGERPDRESRVTSRMLVLHWIPDRASRVWNDSRAVQANF